MIKRILPLLLVAALGVLSIPLTAYAALSSDDDDDKHEVGFLEDWGGYTYTRNQYFFLTDETLTVDNKEVETDPDFAYVYAGTDIYIPIAVYPEDGDETRATAKMIKNDNVSVSSKVVLGSKFVGDIELVDGKKLKLSSVPAGMYVRIPLTPDYSGGGRTTITLRLVLSVHDVTYQDTQVTLKLRMMNRTTEIYKNSVYGAKTPTQFRVRRAYDGEATFDFGNNIKYTAKVKDNASYYLNLSRQPDAAIKEMYPDAFLDFYHFLDDRDTFASSGTLRIPVKRADLAKKGESPSLYVYRIDGSTLTSLGSGVVSYDSKTETLTIKTKTLQNYVLSNRALQKDVNEPEDNDILKSGYAAVSEAEVSEIADTPVAEATAASSVASRPQEDADGYVPEEAPAGNSNNVNDNADTGAYINATNKSSDNPSTSDPALTTAFAWMLAGGALAVLLASFRRPRPGLVRALPRTPPGSARTRLRP